jgi:serine/threonine protein phosphatase PrpC
LLPRTRRWAAAAATTIQDIFQTADDAMKLEEISGGTTACVAIVTDRLLRVANVGDSRCVLIRRVPAGKGEAQDAAESVVNRMEQLSLSTQFEATYSVLALSEDHKPSLPSERKRIEGTGLTVVESRNIEASRDDSRIRLNKNTEDAEDEEDSGNSNNTDLAMSRSLGDYEFKSNKTLTKDQQAVIAVPEIVTRERSPNDELLIVACDGIWDVMTNTRAAEFVVTKLEELGTKDDHPLARVAELLCRECHSLGSADNLSVVLVALGETAERMTPAYVSSPAATTTTDSLPRKLEYESPLVEDSIQEAMDEDTIQDQMVDDTIQKGTATPSFSGELQPTLRTPGQVQTV